MDPTPNQEPDGLRIWHLVASVAMVAAGIAVTSDIWSDILRIATHDDEASHIFLVPLVVAWLVWVRRDRLNDCRRRHTLIGSLFIGTGWLLSTIGYHHAIQSFWHGGGVLVVVGCFVTIMGSDILIRFVPAFAALVFLVPVPGMVRQQVAVPLQLITARLAQAAFDIMGFNIERTGNVLWINGVEVEIAEACNGMRMVFALVLVCYAYAFGMNLPRLPRMLILLGSPLAAIVCNVIRLLPTVWLYGYPAPSAAVRFHDISGWVMLPIAFLLLVGVTKTVRWALVPST
jgi:exosortase